MKKMLLILFVLFACSSIVLANLTKVEMKNLTQTIQEYKRSWTMENTQKIMQAANNSGEVSYVARADDGSVLRIKILGDTVLINGKDVTGNLGSKVTHGDNSPIIDNIRNSQVATGDGSSIVKEENISHSWITVGKVSFVLSLSVLLNVYLACRCIRGRRKSKK